MVHARAHLPLVPALLGHHVGKVDGASGRA